MYNGNVNIHLRHFIEQNGQSIPTKRGVVFNLGRWVIIEEIGEFLETYWKQSAEIQWHVGGGVFVSLTPKYSTVDIRHYWVPPGADKPLHTKKAVCLDRTKFNRLKASLSELHDRVPKLSDVELYMFSESHRNQEGLSMECIASDSQNNNNDEPEREKKKKKWKTNSIFEILTKIFVK